MTADRDELTVISLAVVAEIEPLLHGLGPYIQAAILADLTATWLAGVQGSDAQEVREELLDRLADGTQQ
jgi:hypothetical protein